VKTVSDEVVRHSLA